MDGSDDETFVAFVTGAQRSLQQIAWLMTADVHRAEELVQDCLVRTYGAWPRIGHDNPYGYTRRVLVNARIDSWRRRHREELVDLTPEPRGDAPDESAAVHERLALVAALRTLRPRERAVVVLRYYADLSESETASELGISVGTVKSTASRALAKLRTASEAADAATNEQPISGGAGR